MSDQSISNEKFPATWEGGHALVIEFGDEELIGHCQCGTQFGIHTPAASLDCFASFWERHVMTLRMRANAAARNGR